MKLVSSSSQAPALLASESEDTASLLYWMARYLQHRVLGSPKKTMEAKCADLQRFASFYQLLLGNHHLVLWTPAVTRQFQRSLVQQPSLHTGQPLRPATINRTLATVRHFAGWLAEHCPIAPNKPLDGIQDIMHEEESWRGLSSLAIMRLKVACDQRIGSCIRKNQNPLLETAVFYCLLHTGLRAHELVGLKVRQYQQSAFHQVKRKGKMISTKVTLSAEARERLDRYLATRGSMLEADHVFLSRSGKPLAVRDIERMCEKISLQASAFLPANERFHLTPHQLRHTFLKKLADKHGIHVAQRLSGNVSIRQIFRYTKPSQEEMDQLVGELF
jgi:integrase/recombinase XerD